MKYSILLQVYLPQKNSDKLMAVLRNKLVKYDASLYVAKFSSIWDDLHCCWDTEYLNDGSLSIDMKLLYYPNEYSPLEFAGMIGDKNVDEPQLELWLEVLSSQLLRLANKLSTETLMLELRWKNQHGNIRGLRRYKQGGLRREEYGHNLPLWEGLAQKSILYSPSIRAHHTFDNSEVDEPQCDVPTFGTVSVEPDDDDEEFYE